MKFANILGAVLISCSISSCSIFHFWGKDEPEKTIDPKTLCSSKRDIIANHTYIPSLKACQELSDQGDLNATYVLGLLYTDPNILTSFLDPDTRVEQGIAYVKKAADGGHVQAQSTIASYYVDQVGDLDLAEHYYTMAVNNGNTDSLVDLATIYENKGQCAKAVSTYKDEIKAHGTNADGYFYLTLLYAEGCKDLKQDLNLACGYFSIAQESPIKNTMLKVLEYEHQTGSDQKKDSVTNILKRIHDYESKNNTKCQAAKQKILNQ